MDKKTRIWIIALTAVCIVCALVFALFGALDNGTTAVVRVDGEELYRIDLAAVRESYDINIDTQYGHNTVHVEPGRISVSEADCPDQLCMHQKAISKDKESIICLPNRVVVTVESEQKNTLDDVAG